VHTCCRLHIGVLVKMQPPPLHFLTFDSCTYNTPPPPIFCHLASVCALPQQQGGGGSSYFACSYLGLARTVYIRCIYDIFDRERIYIQSFTVGLVELYGTVR